MNKTHSKRCIFIFILIFLAAPLYLFPQSNEPDDLLEQYFRYMQAMQYDRAYRLLSKEDQDVLSLEDFLAHVESRYGYVENIKKESAVFYNFVQKGFFTFEVLSKKQQNRGVVYNIEIAFTDYNTVAFLLQTALDMESPDITQEEKE